MFKIKDRIVLGLLTGLIGGIPGRMTHVLEAKKGLTARRVNRIGVSLFTRKQQDTSPSGKALAMLATTVNGSVVGIAITYLLSCTGRDHAAIKGMGVGSLTWVVMNGFIGSQLLKQKSKSARPQILFFLDHALNGMLVGLLAAKFGDDSLFPDTKALAPDQKLPTIALNNKQAV